MIAPYAAVDEMVERGMIPPPTRAEAARLHAFDRRLGILARSMSRPAEYQ